MGALTTVTAMSLSAQERAATVEGRVTEPESARPLPGAVVTIEGTALRATTDARGAYRLEPVPPSPHIVLVRFLGYAPARISVTVPTSGSLTVDATLARSALKMADIVVTADPTGRATGEQGTATAIERDAIDNQTATSLSGVLALVPGVPLSPPGLDGVEQFALRSVPTGALASLTTGGPTAGDLASLGTLIILDGVPLSNNANRQTSGPSARVRRQHARRAGHGRARLPHRRLRPEPEQSGAPRPVPGTDGPEP